MPEIALRIVIDGSPAERGAAQVTRSLEQIRAKAAETKAALAGIGQGIGTGDTTAFKAVENDVKSLGNEFGVLTGKATASLGKINNYISPTQQALQNARDNMERLGTATAKTGVAVNTGLGLIPKAANEGKKALDDLTKSSDRGYLSFSALTQELRALLELMSSEDTSVETVSKNAALGVSTATLSIGTAALAVGTVVVAVLATMVAAAANAESAMDRVRGAVKATGEASGFTTGQINEMAKALDATSRLSFRESQAAFSVLASNGKIGGNNLTAAGNLVPDFAQATGLDSTKASEELLKILSDPEKGAHTLFESFSLLTSAQQKHIQVLADTGQRNAAQAAITDEMNKRFGGAAQETGNLTKAFEGLSDFLSNLWSGFGASVQGPMTLEEKRDALVKTQKKDMGGLDAAIFGPTSNGLRRQSDRQSRIDDLSRQISDRNAAASQSKLNAEMSETINKADGVADKYKTAADRTRDLTHESELLDRGLDNAKQQYRQLINEFAKKPNDAGLKAQVEEAGSTLFKLKAAGDGARIAKDNQRSPGQFAQDELADARKTFSAPQRDRDNLNMRLSAGRDRQRNLSNPATAMYADEIYKAKMSEVGLRQQATNRDAITNAIEETDAQKKLAEAYKIGGAAVAEQQVRNEAHAAWLKGTILDEQTYARALLDRASAQAAAASAANINAQQEANAGLQRVANAGGSPSAVGAASRLNEAMQATKAERDLAAAEKDPARIATAQKHLDILKDELTVRDRLTRAANDNSTSFGLEQSIEKKTIEISLIGKSIEFRAHELALIEAKQALEGEGWAANEVGYTQELARREQLIEKLNKQTEVEQGIQRENQRWQSASRQFAGDLGNSLENVILKGQGVKQVFSDLLMSVADLIFKLMVVDPLIKALGGDGGKSSGGILQAAGSWASSLFFADGGIMTAGGSVPLNKYANGGIANKPQMAMFGEGRTPEAYVPLPDGRSIPVTMNGSGGGGTQMNTFEINVTVSGGSSGDPKADAAQAERIGATVRNEVRKIASEEIRSAMRPGGQLNP